MKPTVKTGTALLLLLALLISQSGCTYMLWTDDNLEAYRAPAPNPDLHLYQSSKQDDVLVVYREESERNDAIRTRAYWLYQNQIRLNRQRAPIFASKELREDLPAIPVYYFPPTMETNENYYAVCGTDRESFVLYTTNAEVGTFDLPVYHDGRGRVEKIILTPVAVSVDVVAGAAILAILALCNADYGDDNNVVTPEPAHNNAHWSHH